MIGIETLHHVSVPVIDLARAKAFYGGLLGLPELPRPPFDFEGAWYALGDRQLHLIVHPPSLALRRSQEIDARDAHFAVRVASFDGMVAHLKAAGIAIRESRNNVTPWMQVHVTDPDGHVIEFNAPRAPGDA